MKASRRPAAQAVAATPRHERRPWRRTARLPHADGTPAQAIEVTVFVDEVTRSTAGEHVQSAEAPVGDGRCSLRGGAQIAGKAMGHGIESCVVVHVHDVRVGGSPCHDIETPAAPARDRGRRGERAAPRLPGMPAAVVLQVPERVVQATRHDIQSSIRPCGHRRPTDHAAAEIFGTPGRADRRDADGLRVQLVGCSRWCLRPMREKLGAGWAP